MKWTILLTLLTFAQLTMAQGLNDLRWKNRLIVTNHSQLANDQLTVLHKDSLGVKERKLMLLLVEKDKLKQLWPENKTLASNFKEKLFRLNKEVLLVGLDGGVKKRNEEAFSKKELFSIIDSMPMRAAEIKKGGNE